MTKDTIKITYTSKRMGCWSYDSSRKYWNTNGVIIKHTPWTKEQLKSIEEGIKKLGEEE